jgi:hypothetical protein
MTDEAPPVMFRGEESLAALLLAMLLQHSETATRGELDSYAIAANTEAKIACAEDGCIEITHEAGGRIFAVVTPEGWTLLSNIYLQREGDQAGTGRPRRITATASRGGI